MSGIFLAVQHFKHVLPVSCSTTMLKRSEDGEFVTKLTKRGFTQTNQQT